MCSVSQVSAGRRNGRVDRNRRRSFNIPIVRAKFTLLAFAAGFVARLLSAQQAEYLCLLPASIGATARTTSRLLRASKFYNGLLASKDRFSLLLEINLRNFSTSALDAASSRHDAGAHGGNDHATY
jgi:hypothetical protein